MDGHNFSVLPAHFSASSLYVRQFVGEALAAKLLANYLACLVLAGLTPANTKQPLCFPATCDTRPCTAANVFKAVKRGDALKTFLLADVPVLLERRGELPERRGEAVPAGDGGELPERRGEAAGEGGSGGGKLPERKI